MQKIISFIWFFLCFSPFLQGQTIKYVKADATGLNNGQSWQDAFVNLKHALAAANYGDTLWVAQGVYIPYSVNNSRDSSFILKNGVSIYGGFSGNETALSQRNMAQYPTILSGDIGVPGDSTDNVYNVLLGREVDTTTVLDGLVVEYGYADFLATPSQNRGRGGGLFLRPLNTNSTAAPIVRYCIFRNNYAAGGGADIFSYNFSGSVANVRIEHTQFTKNYSPSFSVSFSTFNGDIYVTDCVFFDNINAGVGVGHFGGACRLYFLRDTLRGNINFQSVNLSSFGEKPSNLFISQCVFEESARCKIISENSHFSSTISVKDCAFTSNEKLEVITSSPKSLVYGCEFNKNNSIDITGDPTNLVYEDNIFNKNNKIDVLLPRTKALFKKNTFIGGVISIRSAPAEQEQKIINNCLFVSNKLKIAQSSYSSTVPVSNHFNYCTFIGSTSIVDTIPMFDIQQGDSLTFNSCVFAIPPGNAPFIANRTSPDQHISVTNSVFSVSDCSDISEELGAEICANNQTGAFIEFVDTLNGDFRLLPCSPGINAGNLALANALGLTTDLTGAPRVANGLPDAGAAETAVDKPGFTTQAVSCPGKSDGAIVYTNLDCNVWNYTWTSSNGATGTLLDNLTAGEYFITLSNNNNGLLWTETVLITALPVSWTADFAFTPASSATTTDGVLEVFIATGGGTFTYLWSNGATTAQINQLAAGTYTVTITNGDGCSAVYSQILGISATGETALPVVHLSPNPVRAGEHLQLPEIGWTSLELHDATGRRVWNVQNGGNQVVLPASIPEGLYRVLLYGKNGGIGYATVVVVR